MMNIYAYPRLSKADLWFLRIGGDGLGNLLFNWARCLSASRQRGWRMVWPTWKSHKPKNRRVNPYDYRLYNNLFRPTDAYVYGIAKPLVLASRRWLSEAEALRNPPRGRALVQFRGMAGKFEPFLHDRELVRDELLAMTREQHLAGYRASDAAPISIHVRLGDFRRLTDRPGMLAEDNVALPMHWYIELLEAVRRHTGYAHRAQVFSDGTEAELAALLSMPGVQRVEYGSAIADLLALSRARLLIASGSTFSMWASFLHQAPTVWHAGKWQQRLHERDGTEFEWSPGDALPAWLDAAWLERWPAQEKVHEG